MVQICKGLRCLCAQHWANDETHCVKSQHFTKSVCVMKTEAPGSLNTNRLLICSSTDNPADMLMHILNMTLPPELHVFWLYCCVWRWSPRKTVKGTNDSWSWQGWSKSSKWISVPRKSDRNLGLGSSLTTGWDSLITSPPCRFAVRYLTAVCANLSLKLKHHYYYDATTSVTFNKLWK